jgi:hypothetical protein
MRDVEPITLRLIVGTIAAVVGVIYL